MIRRTGIEVSTTAVRIAVVAAGEPRPKLLAFAQVPLPYGAVADGGIVDRGAVRQALAECVKEVKLPRRSFARAEAWLSVAGLRAITREIEMPEVPDAELDAAVQLQSLDILPFPVDEALLSARRVAGGPTPSGDSRVLLAAAHRDLVEPVVELVEEAGISVAGVDLASSALVRCFADPRRVESAAEAIVSIGAELTTVVVHDGGEPSFVRTISGGGSSVTRAIARAIDIPFAEAERLKLDLPATAEQLARVRPEVVTAARDGAMELLNEIRSSIEYYSMLRGRTEVRRVVLTGGGSQLPELLERLQLQMRAPVEAGHCFERIHAGVLREHATAVDRVAAVAVGMALNEPTGLKRIDLLPPEILARRRIRRNERMILTAAAMVALILAGLGVLRFVQVRSAEHDAGLLQASIATLQRDIPKYNQVAQQHQAILADESLAMPLVSHEVNWPAVLVALRAHTPSSVSASGFSGSAAAPVVTSTSAATGSPTSAAPTQIGTLNLNLSGNGYPSFQQWFNAMLKSGAFQIVQYSGISSTSNAVHFTAELGITGAIRTDRLSVFEEAKP
ncbi:MAG TPA: type IV pilus assembly protein PilM [Acidimicrobiales bacterium]|nr:type IV pilus assembly protein PilM [Acidimicrobiales bacterium]